MKPGWIAAIALLSFPMTASTYTVKTVSGKYDISTEKVSRILGEITAASADAYDEMFYSTMWIKGDRLVIINSPGGEAVAGNRIISTMELERNTGTRVICYVAKLAASMAFNILTHCDVRISSPVAHLLFHRLAYEDLHQGAERFTAIRLREMAQELDTDDAPFAIANAKALKMKMREYFIYADYDHDWLAKDLLARGYLHDIGTIINR